MNIQKGVVTLTLLMLLSSVLLILLFFDGDLISLHSSIVSQRKIYLEQSLILQRQSISQKEKLCENQPLNNNLKSLKIEFESRRKIDRTSQFVWCERKYLFKKRPKKATYEAGLSQYINLELLDLFQHKLHSPPAILPRDKANYLYWVEEKSAELEIQGNINAVVIAEGDLKLTGKGKISGTVITGGKLSIEPAVKIVYRSKTIIDLIRSYSYWQFAENSWYDFQPL